MQKIDITKNQRRPDDRNASAKLAIANELMRARESFHAQQRAFSRHEYAKQFHRVVPINKIEDELRNGRITYQKDESRISKPSKDPAINMPRHPRVVNTGIPQKEEKDISFKSKKRPLY